MDVPDQLESTACWIEGHPALDDGDPEALLIRAWHVTALRRIAAQLRGDGTAPDWTDEAHKHHPEDPYCACGARVQNDGQCEVVAAYERGHQAARMEALADELGISVEDAEAVIQGLFQHRTGCGRAGPRRAGGEGVRAMTDQDRAAIRAKKSTAHATLADVVAWLRELSCYLVAEEAAQAERAIATCEQAEAREARLRAALEHALEWLEDEGCDCGVDEPGTCALCEAKAALAGKE